jgi:hypothetical protein
MRRGIEIRIAFAPTRLSTTHLRVAYAVVSTVVERTVVADVKRGVADQHDGAAHVARQRRRAGGER